MAMDKAPRVSHDKAQAMRSGVPANAFGSPAPVRPRHGYDVSNATGRTSERDRYPKGKGGGIQSGFRAGLNEGRSASPRQGSRKNTASDTGMRS